MSKRLKVLIVSGGSDSERKISLWSARTVKKGLDLSGYQTKLFNFNKGVEELKKILPNFDTVFPVMHGRQGEDGSFYRLLKSFKKPYVGSDPMGARIAFNKISSLKFFKKNNILSAKWRRVKNRKDIENFGFPCVLKAAFGGSSKEVVILNTAKDLKKRLAKKILILKDPIYIERMLSGIEITVGVLKNRVLPVLEIIPPKGGWFDYKNKYSGGSQEIPFAPSVNKIVQKRAQKIALEVHKKLKLGSYSRSDFIVVNNTPVILEVNTPGGVGMTPESLFPKEARAAGISYEALVKKLVEDSLGHPKLS